IEGRVSLMSLVAGFQNMRLISSLFSIRISRWAKLLAGLAFVGIGVAFTKQANLGLGPWDVLGDGLAHLIGIQLVRHPSLSELSCCCFGYLFVKSRELGPSQ